MRSPAVEDRRRARRAGFVLVEALATLAIGVVILAGLGSLLGMMARQGDRLAERIERLDVVDRVFAALARELGAASRARWAGPGRRSFVFSGRPDRLLFTLDRADGAGGIAPVAVLLQSAAAEGGEPLLRAEAPLSPLSRSAGELDFGPSAALYAGPAALRFAYVAAATGNLPEILLDDWTAGEALPIAIRVALTDPATGAILSSLRVPLRIEAEPGCVAPRKAYCSRIDDRSLTDSSGEPAAAASPQATGGPR